MKKDVWRAPGNQSHVRKLIHVMQHGRLVNIDNFSVYTAASVIKKFLCKVPNGILGPDNEDKLFEILNYDDTDKQREAFCRIVSSLPVPSQHLLVLLFGTFRLIADAADTFSTRMTPEAIGVSVAPSLFHSCIHDGQRAKIEDVVRFRSASRMVTLIIQNFGFTNLFPRENYEFYARITGRTLRVDENWHFIFQYPANSSPGAASASCGQRNWWNACLEGPSAKQPLALGGNYNVTPTDWCVSPTANAIMPLSQSLGLPCNLNRSRSSPARVNPFGLGTGNFVQLTGSWTNLLLSKVNASSNAAALETKHNYGDEDAYSAEDYTELKACSCEF